MKIPHRFYLSQEKMPKYWYNLVADMKNKPAPLINPGTGQPLTVDELSAVFCRESALQETNTKDAFIEIPDEVIKMYEMYRPSPIVRAYNLEKYLNTPARIYCKFEGNNTSGSHKLNSAVAQAYYAKKEGLTSLTTETGAGQWGTALSEACSFFGIDLTIFMVKSSAEQKPQRKTIMQTFGAKVEVSPGTSTKVGREMLAAHPDSTGSLGTAIAEAVEKAVTTPNCRYVLGSVLNHVLLHQSIIGLEAKAALEEFDVYPDIIIGCAGGGSNLGGLMAPFMRDKILNGKKTQIIAVEPETCPSLTKGEFKYDFCDCAKITPMAKMYTLGHDFMPPATHAGGLRYHGMSPIVSQLYADELIEAVAVGQKDVFEAAVTFAKQETILPAPESSHALRVAIDKAIECRESGEAKNILVGVTGTGFFDLKAYSDYIEGKMK